MLIGKVIGNVWATRKDPKLSGLKLMVVEIKEGSSVKSIVAADYIGAGIGDNVIVVSGSSAPHDFEPEPPVEEPIVGLIAR